MASLAAAAFSQIVILDLRRVLYLDLDWIGAVVDPTNL